MNNSNEDTNENRGALKVTTEPSKDTSESKGTFEYLRNYTNIQYVIKMVHFLNSELNLNIATMGIKSIGDIEFPIKNHGIPVLRYLFNFHEEVNEKIQDLLESTALHHHRKVIQTSVTEGNVRRNELFDALKSKLDMESNDELQCEQMMKLVKESTVYLMGNCAIQLQNLTNMKVSIKNSVEGSPSAHCTS